MSNKINYNDLAPLDPVISSRMSKELKLCLWLVLIYLAYMFIVPILNFTAPELMKTRIWGGMSLTWFLTAIGAMVMAFAVAAIHVYFYTKDFFISDAVEEKTGKGADM